MTSPGGSGSSSSALKRYGPLIAIVVVLVAVVGVVVLSGGGDDGQTATSDTTGSGSGSGSNASTADGDGVDTPITYQEAEAAGTTGDVTWVDNCDPQTGRIEIPSAYAPPCVPKFEGDNGGATSPGVTGDSIKIVAYVPPENADVTGALQGATDEPEQTRQTRDDWVKMLQDVSETYGRTVDYVQFQGTGAGDDVVAAQADATSIIDMQPFAVIGGPPQTPVFAEEVATAKIICIDCALALPDTFAQEHAPYIWGVGPSPEEFLTNFTGYVQNSLLGRKAEFAGDPAMRDEDRVFGVVHFEQDPPVFSALTERLNECGAQQGYNAAVTETYEFEIGKLPERATTVIAKMKAEGVTTVMFLGDPIMPIYLTQQATAQDYHPEWVIAGTAYTDTTALGRLYDQDQWRHAFGVSNLSARTPREISGAYQLHEWYFGKPPVAEKTSGVLLPPLSLVFLGIHLAGPDLTPETFRAGLFGAPPAGGGATSPLVSYGPDSGFKMIGDNCELDAPRPDYFGIDDTTEIWWDADATGVDEQGKEGKGMWVYANGAKRYGPGQMPHADSSAFVRDNTVMIFDAVPVDERPPDYPSPAATSSGS